jgi:hypothetical protein
MARYAAAMKRMRTRTLTAVLLVLVVAPGVLFYVLTRTAFYGEIVKLLGANIMLAMAIVLLVMLIAAAAFALVYGLARDDDRPLRRRHKRRKS